MKTYMGVDAAGAVHSHIGFEKSRDWIREEGVGGRWNNAFTPGNEFFSGNAPR